MNSLATWLWFSFPFDSVWIGHMFKFHWCGKIRSEKLDCSVWLNAIKFDQKRSHWRPIQLLWCLSRPKYGQQSDQGMRRKLGQQAGDGGHSNSFVAQLPCLHLAKTSPNCHAHIWKRTVEKSQSRRWWPLATQFPLSVLVVDITIASLPNCHAYIWKADVGGHNNSPIPTITFELPPITHIFTKESNYKLCLFHPCSAPWADLHKLQCRLIWLLRFTNYNRQVPMDAPCMLWGTVLTTLYIM